MFKKLINLFLLFVLVICVSGCEEKKKHVDDINSNQLNQLHLTKQQESQIETAIAIEEEIDIETKIPAQFKARNNSQEHIFSPISGKIEEVYANPGQKILKGQKIVKIKSDEIGQIQLEFLEKAMQLESEIIQKRVSVNLSEKTFQREKRLFEEKITSKAAPILNKGGYLLFELGIGQSEDVKKILEDNGFGNIEIIKDLAGIDRVISAALK